VPLTVCGAWLAWESRLDRRVVAVLAVPLGLWLAHVIRVGGDFMEYRFIVPVLPLAFLGTCWVMCTLDRLPTRAAMLTSIVMAGGMATYSSPKIPKPVRANRAQAVPIHGWVPEYLDSRAWQEIGRDLRSTMPPYIIIDASSEPTIRRRNPAIMELIASRYKVAFVGASGTWYVRR
jgi:hypothetical protein